MSGIDKIILGLRLVKDRLINLYHLLKLKKVMITFVKNSLCGKHKINMEE